MKDIKHIRRDFYSVPWSTIRGGGGGGGGGGGWGHFFYFTKIQPDLMCELLA